MLERALLCGKDLLALLLTPHHRWSPSGCSSYAQWFLVRLTRSMALATSSLPSRTKTVEQA